MARRRGRHRARKQRCGRRLADLAPRLGHALGGAGGALGHRGRLAARTRGRTPRPRAQRAAPRLQGARPGRGGGVLAPAPPLRSPLHRGGGDGGALRHGRRTTRLSARPARRWGGRSGAQRPLPARAASPSRTSHPSRGTRGPRHRRRASRLAAAQRGAPSGTRRTALLGRRRGAGPGLLLRLARLFFCRRGLACRRRARSDRHAHRLAAPLS